MVVLSNVEFAKLVEGQSPMLRAIANKRCDSSPNGSVTLDEIKRMISTCAYCGDAQGNRYLKSLASLAQSGQLQDLRSGRESFDTHRVHIGSLVKKGEVPFDIFDSVVLKESGQRGTIVDYNADTKEYLVSLDPFHLRVYPKGELEKVARKQ